MVCISQFSHAYKTVSVKSQELRTDGKIKRKSEYNNKRDYTRI